MFVLREVFDVGYGEIAEAVGKTAAAVRQIAHRSRKHVDARRPRQVVSTRQARAALVSFQQAVETGDLQGVLDVLAPAPRKGRGRAWCVRCGPCPPLRRSQPSTPHPPSSKSPGVAVSYQCQ